ncbi:cell division protein ZapA [Novosphingobium sp. BL-52-GroH]|uniref:cell division protein ZapA n=1 Tax=Novosphingobium sp. BL-52-GroH TaxID=3349877 RepID=UPI00384D7B82
MGNVTLSIGGRSFTLASADGEEAHVARLGRLIDEKAAASGAAGQTETRMLLFASLMLADELHELRNRPSTPEIPAELAERLGRIASHVENLASLLESEAASA